MDLIDLADRFVFHPADTEAKKDAHAEVRDLCWTLAEELNARLPDGREKALAMTNLEQVMFWGNAAIARQK